MLAPGAGHWRREDPRAGKSLASIWPTPCFRATYHRTSPPASRLTPHPSSHVRTQVLDIYIGSAVLTIVLQFAYALLFGTFPFNSFLAGVFCCAGSAVLTLCLRLQISSGQADMSVDRAFVDYTLAMVVLFLACLCYLG